MYNFYFEAKSNSRAFSARLGTASTSFLLIKTTEFKQKAGGFNMLLIF